jgi:hypothetical protein
LWVASTSRSWSLFRLVEAEVDVQTLTGGLLFSQQSGHAGTRHYGSVEARAVAWSNKYSTTGLRIREGSACVLSASQSARWPREP